ncbi:hypothetical protein OUZ56_027634 [Daphnia magna]|uniref:Uncharacterized protein n=1 Tax=Daphnia magna TaxID=35525 RepID=A0ABR0B1H5_9CRUS|nr:hypothetical protein OUZ56_027634 [Daphnia magna]
MHISSIQRKATTTAQCRRKIRRKKKVGERAKQQPKEDKQPPSSWRLLRLGTSGYVEHKRDVPSRKKKKEMHTEDGKLTRDCNRDRQQEGRQHQKRGWVRVVSCPHLPSTRQTLDKHTDVKLVSREVHLRNGKHKSRN